MSTEPASSRQLVVLGPTTVIHLSAVIAVAPTTPVGVSVQLAGGGVLFLAEPEGRALVAALLPMQPTAQEIIADLREQLAEAEARELVDAKRWRWLTKRFERCGMRHLLELLDVRKLITIQGNINAQEIVDAAMAATHGNGEAAR